MALTRARAYQLDRLTITLSMALLFIPLIYEEGFFAVTQSIISILFEFTLVRVEKEAPISAPESALWTVPTLLLALLWLLLGSR